MDHDRSNSAETQRLLKQVRTGDRQAFEQLLALHRPYLRQLVELRLDPKLRPRVDPSDVVQEAQIDAVRRLDAYLEQTPMPFRLWLRQLAHDRLLMMRRRHVKAARRAVSREITRKWSRRHKPVVWSAVVSVLALLSMAVAALAASNVPQHVDRERHPQHDHL